MRRYSAAIAALVATVTIVVGVVASTSGSGSREPQLGALLDRVVAAGAPGALVVVRQGTVIRSEARGSATGDRSPLRADARFRVGSVTKTFVAALVLELAQEGTLQLDDTVARWLPGVVPGGDRITLRHLLAHRSGLFDYVDDPRVLSRPERHWKPRELVRLALAHPRVYQIPGGRFAYSSTNYVLLGLIVEAAVGEPLERQLRERLFEPLGLRHTSFAAGGIGGSFVHGHRPPSHQGVVTGPPVDIGAEPAWWAWAAGAIVSDAADVQRFFATLLRGRLLSPSSLREMETVLPAGRQRYGLGLATFPTPCGRAWGHTGNVQGTITVAWNTRDASRQLVLVVNTYPLSAELEAAVRELQDAAFCDGA
jgi:D-alanyl-D-alanine carboxypeptidase